MCAIVKTRFECGHKEYQNMYRCAAATDASDRRAPGFVTRPRLLPDRETQIGPAAYENPTCRLTYPVRPVRGFCSKCKRAAARKPSSTTSSTITDASTMSVAPKPASVDRDSPPCTIESIEQIERDLGDFTRARDFPMSRVRGASNSTCDSAFGPAEGKPQDPTTVTLHRTTTPTTQIGNGLLVPKVRSQSLSPGHNAPRRRNRTDGDLGAFSRFHSPLRSSSSLAVPLAHANMKLTKPPPAGLHLSSSSSSQAASPAVSSILEVSFDGLPPPGQGFRDHLIPDHPDGYPQPPSFLHNWTSPNRRRGHKSIDPRRAHRAHKGPPIGSKPRPRPPMPAALPGRREVRFDTAASTRETARPQQGGRSIPRLDTPGQGHPAFSPFAYTSLMSPYEAEAASNMERRAQETTPTEEFPSFDTGVMSPDQAEVACKNRRRGTIFIDKGFDGQDEEKDTADEEYADQGEEETVVKLGGVAP
ncbi:hypothetical protein B0T19DRAFT_404013 [Cercophora scortea]|uniref:Uncharacterized protein n=1 Tax=Cercophora scortea TaxID=314031 RepID=A0AAE0IAC7_9PEZI|nr:hypothetical protein B0T19DRAFT_404013 [Cercophora scortea]